MFAAGRGVAIHYMMRVRITASLHGSIDGIQLDRFVRGNVYDVGVPLACFLLATHAAVPVGEDVPATTVLPPSKRLFGPALRAGFLERS